MPLVTLEVVEGPDRGESRLLGPGQRLVIGRAASCELRLNDAGCSRRHCAVELRPGGLWVEDLGSRGGTLLLGREFRGSGALVPIEGARVCLGGTELRFGVRVGALGPLPEVSGYVLEERLGEGGSGEVYAGRELSSGLRVAIKILREDADDTTRARAAREARLASQLHHPGIARVLRLIEEGEQWVLIRELAEGESLEDRLAQGSLPWREAFRLGAAVADALEAAHQHGVVHRDVKPANVVCSPTGPRLIDFDLALNLGGTLQQALTRLTQTGQGLGTLCYLPPEQLRDAHHAGPRSDVYGLGLTLHHALTGSPPFGEVGPDEFLSALLETGPSPLKVEALPSEAARVVTQAYALKPSERHASAGAFAAALRAALA
ncbi:MAG: protein kinase [Planctomycetes bacterium]|nr:protein kinase [Planctomycetota bacterium]